jgi:RNA polymerase primary sigma factor
LPRKPLPLEFAPLAGNLGGVGLLGADEEREVLRRIRQGDREASARLIQANAGLVVWIAQRHTGKGLELEDLISEGQLGLLRAVSKFDPRRAVRFSTYAVFWIRQHIRRALAAQARPCRIPVGTAHGLARWQRAETALRGELRRAPTPEEVARRLNLSPRGFAVLRQAVRVVHASCMRRAEPGRALEQMCADGRAGPLEAAQQAEEVRWALGLLDRLDPRSATVLRLRFGLDGHGPRTLQAIGTMFGLTRERIRKIQDKALQRLQAAAQLRGR